MKNVKVPLNKNYLIEASWGVAKDRITIAMQDDKLDELLLLCEKRVDGGDITAATILYGIVRRFIDYYLNNRK